MRSRLPSRAGLEPGAGSRRQAADVVVHLARRPREVDARLALVDLGGVGDARRPAAACRRARRAPGRPARAPSAPAPRCASTSCSSPAVMSGADRHALREADGPGVEPLVHAHDASPPSRVSPAMMARWIGAAPRQRGRAEACRLRQPCARRVEDRLRQDQAVGDDDGDVGARARRTACCSASPLRLRGVSTRNAGRLGERVHRRLALRHAAPGRPRRLRVDGGDLVPGRRRSPPASARRSPACP